ncbi:MAG: hypothetical protein N2487_01670 [Verrucomicrobiae bacterium]|nr:hypothetical protein [Verrucomicrobiae bacterium]
MKKEARLHENNQSQKLNYRLHTKIFHVQDYNLDLTLDSGQTFRWQKINGGWEGVVSKKWVRLEHHPEGLKAAVCEKINNWTWLEDYLQIKADIKKIIHSFPEDEHMNQAIKTCRGLRIVKQEPWECLATFLMSSSKQIVQIKQIIHNLCEQFGEPISSPNPALQRAFPEPTAIAAASETELRACKMGFRATYLKNTAQIISDSKINLSELTRLPLEQARNNLLSLPGVGPKIANCVLLFSLGFMRAFPVDVWVKKVLQTCYNKPETLSKIEIEKFIDGYFGEYAGYAQQYLFHFIRIKNNRVKI